MVMLEPGSNSPDRRRPILRSVLISGAILFCLHSLAALYMFLRVYSDRGVAQAEMAWMVFFTLDYPTPQLTFAWLGSTPPMQALFDWGYDLVGSGPNLRAFAMVVVAGGLHWFLIGGILGAGFALVHRGGDDKKIADE
jgi:hypothetical protein